jgi:hypothetical protein
VRFRPARRQEGNLFLPISLVRHKSKRPEPFLAGLKCVGLLNTVPMDLLNLYLACLTLLALTGIVVLAACATLLLAHGRARVPITRSSPSRNLVSPKPARPDLLGYYRSRRELAARRAQAAGASPGTRPITSDKKYYVNKTNQIV